MKTNSYWIEKWYTNIAWLLILIAVALSVCTFVSLFLVGDIVSDKLYQMTVSGILQSQAKAASQISYHILDMPAAIGNFLDLSKTSEIHDANPIFRKFSSVEKEVIALSIIEYDANENIIRVLESSSSTDHQKLLQTSFHSRTQLVYGDNTILSIGRPYKDSMGIYTIVPVFFTQYDNGKISKILVIEYNISVLFFNTVNSSIGGSDQYSYCIYSQDNLLIETSNNYMRVREPTLQNAEALNLSPSEMNTIKTTGSYYKTSGSVIELYNSSQMGYIIKGEVSTKVIEQTNKEITSIILDITILSICLLFLMSGILLHLKKTREHNIRLVIETIQAKLDPHFLFNTLNSMVGLVTARQEEKLMKGFRDLSIFLRSSIDTRLFVSLREELQLLNSYFEIQKIRYIDTFDYSYDIESDELLDSSIPRFTIQPIVENCFVHAVALITSEEKVHIKVKIGRAEKKDLFICITNSGIGFSGDLEKIRKSLERDKVSDNQRHGIGLFLINKELKLLYGKKYGLKLGTVQEDIFEIIITVPFNR